MTSINRPPAAKASVSKTYRNKRVSFLAPRILRLEYSEQGLFEDRRTLSIINREVLPVKLDEQHQGNTHIIDTGAVRVELLDDGLSFSPENLKVTFHVGEESKEWFPGKKDELNLGGTLRTLDNLDGYLLKKEGIHGSITQQKLPDGLLSRSGWCLVDDSLSVPLEENGEDCWVAGGARGARQDLYFFAYGRDYKAMLKDSAHVFGRQPLPPRFAFGYWWSRYWAYTDKELEQLVKACDCQNIPLDVLVVDMDWHQQGWTGFSWDQSYFPDPDEFLAFMRERKIHVSMNLHPAEGFAAHEAVYEKIASRLSHSIEEKKVIPFDCTNPNLMAAYFEDALGQYERQGVEFWWMDWQQGETCAVDGLDPLTWINYLHWRHLQKNHPERRPLNFSRWGGLGSGRYPIGFSGDSYVSWQSLKILPGFTAAANNVHYGYWSHDIGGHHFGETDGELFTRWMQYGIYSPILRTHATKQSTNDRQFWECGLPYSRLMKEAVKKRYERAPYIYSEARACYDEGISLCRGMYIEHPELDQAYSQDQQYYFGSRLLVAPVTQPCDPLEGQAQQKVWLPKGKWYCEPTGEVFEGVQLVYGKYLLEEIPVFIPAGSVIPGQIGAKRLYEESYSHLVFDIYPGADGRYELYEDDGRSPEYLSEEGVRIACAATEAGDEKRIELTHLSGNFRGYRGTKHINLRLHGVLPPESVTVDGQFLEWKYRPADRCWCYDGGAHSVEIQLGEIDLRKGCVVRLQFAEDKFDVPVHGKKGAYSRLFHAFAASRVLELPWEREIAFVAQTGNRISRKPALCKQELSAFEQRLGGLLQKEEEIRAQLFKVKMFRQKKLAALNTASAIIRGLLKDA